MTSRRTLVDGLLHIPEFSRHSLYVRDLESDVEVYVDVFAEGMQDSETSPLTASFFDAIRRGASEYIFARKALEEIQAHVSAAAGRERAKQPQKHAVERMLREKEAFLDHLPALLQQHEGEFVAMYKRQVLCAGTDPDDVQKEARAHAEVMKEAELTDTVPPILIKKCTREKREARIMRLPAILR